MLTHVARRAVTQCIVCLLFITGLAAVEPLRIVTLGDSITKGVRPGVTAEETFSAELQRNLRDTGHPDCEVINVGIGGEMAGQGLKRLEKDVIAKKPAIVTIMYGHNDCYVDIGKTEARIPIPRFRADLSQLVQRLRESNITPILMTPPAYAEKSGPNGIGEHCNVKLAQYAEVTRQVAETLQVPLVDHYAAWAEMSKSGTDLNEWTTDGYHPNPKGHVELATRMREEVASQVSTNPKPGDLIGNWPELRSIGGIPYRRYGVVEFTEIAKNTKELKFPRLNNVVKSALMQSKNNLSAHLVVTQTPTEWTIALPDDRSLGTNRLDTTTVVLHVDGMPRLCGMPAVSRPGADGVITLSARDAVVHGEKLQFEPLTHKNTVGYWVNPKDYAEWSYALDQPGEFHVEIMQGCGGHAGSDVELGFPEGPVPFVVEETGHFQNFVWRRIGRIRLKEMGVHQVALKCKKLAKGAVMDMRQVRLVPVLALTTGPITYRDVAPDLVPPIPTTSPPAPGRRSIMESEMSVGSHSVYLPTNWTPNHRWPVFVELPGNGYFRNELGDTCDGLPHKCQFAFGLSGGYGAICLTLPFLDENGCLAPTWWGTTPSGKPSKTIKCWNDFIKETCDKYNGDPTRVILVGFSRGSIAVNAVGLSTDEAAGLWKAAVCFSHYDGVGNWPFPKSDPTSAIERLQRLGHKPQFIISESPVDGPALSDQAREFIEKSGVKGDFTFATTGFLNHSDQWALRPSPARTQVREWLKQQMAEK